MRLTATQSWQDARGAVKGVLVWVGVWRMIPASVVHWLIVKLGLKHR